MKTRRTRWYNSLTLRLLVLFWAILFVTASSGFILALWQAKPPQPEPLANEIHRTLDPLLSDSLTFGSLQPGRLVAGDYRVAAKLAPVGKQQFRMDKAIAEQYDVVLLRQIDKDEPQQLQLDNVLLVGPFELDGHRLLLTRPLNVEEVRQREMTEQEAREARAVTLLIASGAFALLLGFWLVRPIHRLIRATREIAEGSGSPQLKSLPKRTDEIGELARALGTTAHDLAVSRDAQRRLLSDVSHELRSPLARMQVALSLCHPADNNGDEDNPHWRQLERDLERLGGIIERILSLSRLENGLVSLNREEVDTGKLVSELIDDLCYVNEEFGDRLSQHPGENDEAWPVLNSDSELLRLVIENIVRNALQYTEGTIEISMVPSIDPNANGNSKSKAAQPNSKAKRTQYCAIVIRDHGTGVEAELLDQMFEPFFRGDPSRHHRAGVGLGMALSRRAAGVLGGKVRARNHPDGGLEVTVSLPLV